MPGGRAQGGGGYFHIRRSGRLDLTSSLEAKFGVRSGQVHQIRGKAWEVLLPQDAKFGGKNPNFGVISENSEGKIWGICHLYFWRQNLGLQQEFQRQILSPSPRSPDMKVPPLKGLFDFWNGVLICLFGVCNLGQAGLPGVRKFQVPNVLSMS